METIEGEEVSEPSPHTAGSALLQRIAATEARVAVVGLGYVGLPVALGFAEDGFYVIGLELNDGKVRALQEGTSYLGDVPGERVRKAVDAGLFHPTTHFADLESADAILICVPTPLTEGAPDLSLVEAAARTIAPILKPGALVILESTTYPGTTEELVQPILEAEGRQAGADFLLAFSPERIDPGNPVYDFDSIPKVVGGIDAASTAAAAALYGRIVPKVFEVSTPKEAELSKLIENTFRHVNIALINELAVYAHEMGVDIWEAIEAAATKPFGFMPFWPGPGWGGHCIPLDPAFLSWRVRRDRAHEVRFVELAQAVNSEMPRHVVERISLLLNEAGRALRGSRILAVGVAYKGGTEDTRESPALRIMAKLKALGAQVSYHDPLVPEVVLSGETLRSRKLDPDVLKDQDLVVVFIRQNDVDWAAIEQHAPRVFDCCNALRSRGPTISRL